MSHVKRPVPPQNPISETMAAAQQAAPQSAPQQKVPPTMEATPRRARSTIVDVNSSLRRPMARNSSGEFVQKFEKSFKKLLGENIGDQFADSIRLLTLDNNNANVALSTLLLCYHEKSAGVEHVAVYSMIVEASSGQLQNRPINIGGQTVEVEVVPGDVYASEDYWKQIESLLFETYGRQLQIHDASAQVLYREIDPEDLDRLRNILYNATSALYTVMDNALGGTEDPFTVAWIGDSDSLTARLDFGSINATNSAGLPERSDVAITLQGSLAGNQSQASFEQVRDLTAIYGYIDLAYQPPAPPALGQPPMTQSYYPRFVMTLADTQIDANTLELQLLALSTATLLSRNRAYIGAFKPRLAVSGVDLHDIGAIGYEVNLSGNPQAAPDRINTKEDSFGPQQLNQLIGATFHEGILYSMDVDEVGELSWIHQTFIAAANGVPTATQAIIDAANALTLNHFGQIFPANEAIAQDDQNRIHLGYFTDVQGDRHDIREIDYLAILNLAGRDHPGLIEEWENTFTQVNVPLEIRLEKRIKLIRGFVSGKLEVKGFARRITFNPNFITALALAAERAGLVIRPSNLVEQFSGLHQRGAYNAGQFAVQGQSIQGLFQYGQQGFNAGSRLFSQPYTGRFNNR